MNYAKLPAFDIVFSSALGNFLLEPCGGGSWLILAEKGI